MICPLKVFLKVIIQKEEACNLYFSSLMKSFYRVSSPEKYNHKMSAIKLWTSAVNNK